MTKDKTAMIPYYEERSVGYWLLIVGALIVGGGLVSAGSLFLSAIIQAS